MAPPAPVRAVLLDGMGTLLRLEDPVPGLRAELEARFGLTVSDARAREALAAEIAFYRRHHLAGHDRASLAALRRRCSFVLAQALGPPAPRLAPTQMTAALLSALSFAAHPDAAGALERLRAMGMRLVAVSNWDVGLHDVLARTGLARRLDGAITSAELGVAKPRRELFDHALTLAGVPAAHALHCGDSLREDVAGARAAGIRAVLLDRAGSAAAREAPRSGPGPGVTTVASLSLLPELVGRSA